MSKKRKLIIVGIIVGVLVVTVVGVGIAVIIHNNQTQPQTQAQTNQFGRGGRVGGANFSNVRGTVSSLDNNTLIVDSDNNQGQKIVLISDSTAITKPEASTFADVVKENDSVIIQGTIDGTTITASEITLSNFSMMGGQNTQSRDSSRMMMGNFPQNTGGTRNNFIGEIESIDGTSFKIKTFRQDENTVNTSSDTKYFKLAEGTSTDLKAGTKVTITGTANSGGTITARNITISSK